MAECADSTPTKSIERVCVSPSSKEQICLLCAKVVSNNDFRRNLTSSGGRKKTKTCFNLESILGKEISQPSSLRSKRFQSSYCAKVRAKAKKGSPPPPPSFMFFFSCPSFLEEPCEETLATQANNQGILDIRTHF